MMTPKKLNYSKRRIIIEPPTDSKASLGGKIQTIPPESVTNRPYIDYRYLIVDESCEYCFIQERFPPEDYRKYFLRVKEYTKKRVCDIFGDDNNRRNGIHSWYNLRSIVC